MAQENYVIAALYCFTRLEDYQRLQPRLKELCTTHDIRGTLLLAREGINGTVAGDRVGIDALKSFLETDGRFSTIEYKESFDTKQPFRRLKVRLKKEIVTIGLPDVDPTQVVGTYVTASEWNALIQDPDVVVLDTRNDYEVAIGTFKGAVNPKTKTFREFPKYVRDNFDPAKTPKVAMFCTGGIRCEKASSFMKMEGFKEVYHLKGGILKYLEDVPPVETLWEGECFVFDQRVAVDHQLDRGHHLLCYGCRRPLRPEDKDNPLYEEGVSCHQCHHETTPEQKKRFADRQRQHQQHRQHAEGSYETVAPSL